jgi:hypothetical protein
MSKLQSSRYGNVSTDSLGTGRGAQFGNDSSRAQRWWFIIIVIIVFAQWVWIIVETSSNTKWERDFHPTRLAVLICSHCTCGHKWLGIAYIVKWVCFKLHMRELCVTLVSIFVQFAAKPTSLNVGRQRSINRTWQREKWLAFLHKPPVLSSNLPYLLTYLPSYLLNHLLTYSLTYLFTYFLLTYTLIYLLT